MPRQLRCACCRSKPHFEHHPITLQCCMPHALLCNRPPSISTGPSLSCLTGQWSRGAPHTPEPLAAPPRHLAMTASQ